MVEKEHNLPNQRKMGVSLLKLPLCKADRKCFPHVCRGDFLLLERRLNVLHGAITRISYQEAKEFLLPRHYSGRVPSITYAYGWKDEEGILQAVLTIGKPASPALCKGVCGGRWSSHVYELNRLCRNEDFTEPLSHLVGYVLRDLKKENLIIVSYADTAMHHVGAIYQACNFIYTGMTKARTDIWSGGHSRHYTSNQRDSGLRVYRSAKHRYIYFCADRWTAKRMRHDLKYKIDPSYPKGDNIHYELGYVLQPKLVEAKKGK